MKSIIYIIQLLLLFTTIACNLEKEIDIDLPEYESVPVVECYLEIGQPFQLLLSRSASYFDSFALDAGFLEKALIQNAKVTITHQGKIYTLNNGLDLDPLSQKFYNYSSTDTVPRNFDNNFELKITLADGRTVEATTRILPVIPIDSVVVQFRENDTLARALTYLTDLPGQANYYRRTLHQSALDSIPDQDFVLDDRIVEKVIVFGTGYDFAQGDTVINTVYHIDRPYYNYLESVFNARDSNGNPFGQPSPVISNLQGTAEALGIFTGVSYDRKTVIVTK